MFTLSLTLTHTHTELLTDCSIYTYIYIYIKLYFSFLYWSDDLNGGIYRMKMNGLEPTRVLDIQHKVTSM